MESKIQNQFTAYLHKALARQRWRSQAKIAQQEYYEQPLLNCDCCALLDQSPIYDVIPLVHTMLTERERNILLWHVLMHMSHNEIALHLGISVSATQKAYQRTLPKLRVQLEKCLYAFC